MKAYYKKNTGFIGVPRYGKLKLEFIVPYRFDIDYLNDDGNPTGKTLVYCRFHSSKEIAFSDPTTFHARAFEYNGVDKSESQLIEWLFSTPNLKPNNAMNITVHNAAPVEEENKHRFTGTREGYYEELSPKLSIFKRIILYIKKIFS